MARRERSGIFGLSMLDTVTCGLGAGIVLMLFAASRVEPEARIVFRPESEQPIAGDPSTRPADGTSSGGGMASVFLFTGETPDEPAVTACSGEAADPVTVSAGHRSYASDPRAQAAGSPAYGFTIRCPNPA